MNKILNIAYFLILITGVFAIIYGELGWVAILFVMMCILKIVEHHCIER